MKAQHQSVNHSVDSWCSRMLKLARQQQKAADWQMHIQRHLWLERFYQGIVITHRHRACTTNRTSAIQSGNKTAELVHDNVANVAKCT